MVTVSLEHNGLWAEADLTGDPAVTARELVLARWLEGDLPVDEARIELLGDVMAVLIGNYQKEDPPPVLAMLLYPYAEEPVVTTVAVRLEYVDVPLRLDEIADDLRLPVEMLELPPLEEIVETPSGQALHLVQRHLSPVAPGVEDVEEHEIYAWSIDAGDGPAVVTLSTTYLDLAAAAEWRDDLAELARGLVVHLS